MYTGRSCWLCGRNGTAEPLDKHHIFGGAYRKKSEKYGLTVCLCHNSCHIFGERAVHNCRETMDALHKYGQKLAMEQQGWTKEDFIREFGRNYLEASECAGAARMDRSEGERRAAEAARRPAEREPGGACSAGRGGTPEWASFRVKAETSDMKAVPTRGKPGVAERTRRDIDGEEELQPKEETRGSFRLLDEELCVNW